VYLIAHENNAKVLKKTSRASSKMGEAMRSISVKIHQACGGVIHEDPENIQDSKS
jgi:hypothetical protein